MGHGKRSSAKQCSNNGCDGAYTCSIGCNCVCVCVCVFTGMGECSYGCTYMRPALESVLGIYEVAVHVSIVLRWILQSGVGLVKLGVTLAFC